MRRSGPHRGCPLTPPTCRHPIRSRRTAARFLAQIAVDQIAADWGFTPIVQVGGSTGDNGVFEAALSIGDLAVGRVSLKDFGPVTLGFADWEVGAVTLAGQLTLGGYQDGLFVPNVAGSFSIQSGLAGTDIGKIEIHDTFTYVAVSASVARDALKSLSNGRIKGKRFRVTLESCRSGGTVARIVLPAGEDPVSGSAAGCRQ